jgi:hypothetical protein
MKARVQKSVGIFLLLAIPALAATTVEIDIAHHNHQQNEAYTITPPGEDKGPTAGPGPLVTEL